MTIAIIIPARYGSTRFPGKPLALLQGRAVIEHVYAKAQKATANLANVTLAIATDDTRIKEHCDTCGMSVIMTPTECATGSDRVIKAAEKLGLSDNDIVLNLQGDAPFVPSAAIKAVIEAFDAPHVQVATPVKNLNWQELELLRRNKLSTPFSGTTAIIGAQNQALWFSKNIIPAIRAEAKLREQSPLSPVYQHLGLYGYRVGALKRFASLPESPYEQLEGLEQLRFLENNIPIHCVPLSSSLPIMSGIDSPEDLARAQTLPLET